MASATLPRSLLRLRAVAPSRISGQPANGNIGRRSLAVTPCNIHGAEATSPSVWLRGGVQLATLPVAVGSSTLTLLAPSSVDAIIDLYLSEGRGRGGEENRACTLETKRATTTGTRTGRGRGTRRSRWPRSSWRGPSSFGERRSPRSGRASASRGSQLRWRGLTGAGGRPSALELPLSKSAAAAPLRLC